MVTPFLGRPRGAAMFHQRRCILFLAVVGLVCIQVSASVSSRPECEANSDIEAAEAAFAKWKSQATGLNDMQPVQRLPDTVYVLHQLGLVSNATRCLFWFEWSPTEGLNVEQPIHHCEDFVPVKQRLALYRLWVALIMETKARPDDFRHRFHFYVDATAAHTHNLKLFHELASPILVQSKWSNDNYSIPIPDAHMVAGHLQDFGVTALGLEKFQQEMHNIYSPSVQYGARNWTERKEIALFRGCCRPTIDTRAADKHVYPRASLCAAASNWSSFEVTTASCDYQCMDGPSQAVCTHCKDCLPSKRKWSRDEMGFYKYQLDIDGFAAAYSGKYIKLKSGGTVFHVRSQDENGVPLRLHEHWYAPMLKHKVNIIESSVAGVGADVEWCVQNDGVCEQIGVHGRKTAVCDITPNASLHYTYLVLKYLHDTWHHPIAV